VNRIEDSAAHVHSVDRRQLGGWTVSTKRDGVLEGGDEDFTIRAGPQMPANLPANVDWEFIVDIGRQLLEKIDAMPLAMRVRRESGPFLWRRCLFLGHEGTPSD
jgi:hypothetical protein